MKKADLQQKELKTISDRLAKIENSLQNNPGFQDSRKTTEYRNKAEATYNEATKILIELKKIKEESNQKVGESAGILDNIKSHNLEAATLLTNMLNDLTSLKSKSEELDIMMESLETFQENHPEIQQEIEQLEELATSNDEVSNKLKAIHKNAIEKLNEIKELHTKVFGFTNIDEDSGKETKIEGLIDNLEEGYSEVQNKVSQYLFVIESFKNEKENQYQQIETNWTKKFTSLEEEIRSLLPNALTAGLSSAYAEKKKQEVTELEKLNKRFRNAVFGMIGVSSIPLVIMMVFILKGSDLYEAILKLPRLTLSILPIVCTCFVDSLFYK